MRIIDEHRRARRGGRHPLEPALGALQAFERLQRHVLRRSCRDHEPRRNQCVEGLKVAGERQEHRMAGVPSLDLQSLAEAFLPSAQELEILAPFSNEIRNEPAFPGDSNNLMRLLGIRMDDGRRTAWQKLSEQPHLGGKIIFEGRVVIEMIPRNVGEGASCEFHAVQTMLGNPVTGCLKRQVAYFVLALEPRQNGVKFDRVGGRVRQVLLATRRHHPDRAETCRSKTHPLPDLPHEGGHRSLAVGSGHRDAEIGLLWIISGGGQREPLSRVAVVDHHGSLGSACPWLRYDGAGTFRNRLADEASSVGARPGKRKEHVAGFHRAAVRGEAGDFNGRVFLAQLHVGPEQRPEFHRHGSVTQGAGIDLLCQLDRFLRRDFGLHSEKRSHALDDLSGRWHGVPAGCGKAVGIFGGLRLIEHD